MPTYENELLARVCALQLEAMLSIGVQADAKPFFIWTQEDFPYFTNRIAANPVGDNGSQDEDLNNPLVVMRLVIGHITEGYKGQPESKLYEYGPVVKAYIQERQWLQTSTGPYAQRMGNLQSARVIDNGGFRAFQDGGINAIQVGREIQLQCIFYEHIEQVYY